MQSRPTDRLVGGLRKLDALYAEGRLDRAEREASKLLKTFPKSADAMAFRAKVARVQRRHAQALTWAQKAQRVAPDHAGAAIAELAALADMGEMDKAGARAEDLIGRTDDMQLRLSWARLLMDRQNFVAALDVLKKGLPNATDGELFAMLGNCFASLHQFEEAIAAFEIGMKVAPDYMPNFLLRANLAKSYEKKDPRVYWLQVLQLDPDNVHALTEFLWSCRRVFDWPSYRKLLPDDFPALRRKGPDANPWFFLSLVDDPEGHLFHQRQMQAARLKSLGLKSPRRAPRPKPHPDGKIRIGYYSSDFHNHATLKLMSGMLREHDRDAFEIHCFDFGKNDSVTSNDMAHVDGIHRVNFKSDAEITELSRSLGIDIAVDLKGETAGNRIGLFLLGQAPVQINYLGYPGTLGTSAFDYIIGDPVLIPPEHDGHFDEKVIRLPTCYLPHDDRRRADLPPTRTELGLPEEAIVLACLNDHYKISADLFAVWAEALKAAPKAVLWLLEGAKETQDNLLHEAAAAGIAPERIVFADRLEHHAHVTRLAQADLYLDTLNCTAHTLAADAVCGANLPLLTCAGRQFAARVGASFIAAAGLPELVCGTLGEYREALLSLVTDPDRLLELRGRLAQNRGTAPLFSSRSYTRFLEQGYRTAHARSRAGRPARSFDISPDAAGSDASDGAATLPPGDGEDPATSFRERIAYDACPVCGSSDFETDRVADCSRHPSWKPPLAPRMTWNRCRACGHEYTDGYLTDDARHLLHAHVPVGQGPGENVEGNRSLSSLIVDKVGTRKTSGRWLDVGFGNGSLLFTAREYGFEVLGLDRRAEAVQQMEALGVRAQCGDICEVSGLPRVDVISISEQLLSTRFPVDALRAAYAALADDGVLYLSVPNTDALLWKRWRSQNTNPYWAEIRHHHNFGRERLCRMLTGIGFARLEYGINVRYRCGMGVLAQKPR